MNEQVKKIKAEIERRNLKGKSYYPAMMEMLDIIDSLPYEKPSEDLEKAVSYGGYKYHLVLSFEDNGETFYVMKYYGHRKQWWHYEVWNEVAYKSVTKNED